MPDIHVRNPPHPTPSRHTHTHTHYLYTPHCYTTQDTPRCYSNAFVRTACRGSGAGKGHSVPGKWCREGGKGVPKHVLFAHTTHSRSASPPRSLLPRALPSLNHTTQGLQARVYLYFYHLMLRRPLQLPARAPPLADRAGSVSGAALSAFQQHDAEPGGCH
jgi:hypothetical protein